MRNNQSKNWVTLFFYIFSIVFFLLNFNSVFSWQLLSAMIRYVLQIPYVQSNLVRLSYLYFRLVYLLLLLSIFRLKFLNTTFTLLLAIKIPRQLVQDEDEFWINIHFRFTEYLKDAHLLYTTFILMYFLKKNVSEKFGCALYMGYFRKLF